MMAPTKVRFDGWRIGWTLDGNLCSPLRGRGTSGFGVTNQLLRSRPLMMNHDREWAAECHTRAGELSSRPASLDVDHEPPDPDCYCGIHACDQLSSIVHLAKSLKSASGIVRKQSRNFHPDRVPPGIGLYRVELLDRIEQAVYIHADIKRSAGWFHDPPGTWRGARARVIGPIIATNKAEIPMLEARYEVPALWLGDDMNLVVADLMRREPTRNQKPCPECRYRVFHAASCPKFAPWWIG